MATKYMCKTSQEIAKETGHFIAGFVCSIVPELKEACAVISDNVIDSVIDLIGSEVSAEFLCKLLNLCNDDGVPPALPYNAVILSSSQPQCVFCKQYGNLIK